MKNIYLGDTHGRDTWKQIVAAHPDADNVVFIGDYFDSYEVSGIEQLRNAEEIVQFKRDREEDPTKRVYLLIGNHDHHYWPGVTGRGTTSGFQATMSFQYEQFFRDNIDAFQMAVLVGNRLCTHAGVCSQFLKETGYWTYDKHSNESHVADFLNDLFHYKPNEFCFDAFMDRNEMGGWWTNPYGDNEGQSPIWIRPKSLQNSNRTTDLRKKYVQIVGHTQQTGIDIKGKSTGGKYYYIDTIAVGQYLIDVDGEFSIGTV